MVDRKTKILGFAAFLTALAVVFAIALHMERQVCMGVPVTEEARLMQYTEDLEIDIGGITFCGKPVAADLSSGTLFISQPENAMGHWSALQGTLKPQWMSQSMYFVRDDALQDIETAVREGNPLTLAVVQGKSYCRLNVQITTLPVIRLTQDMDVGADEQGRTVWAGDVTLFAGDDPSKGRMTAESYAAQSHVRGATSAHQAKKPWKLSLKDENGENRHADLLGMGADDDWILNPMNMDDTKLREKCMIDAWNRHIAAFPENGYRMSDAQYVEVVLDGSYQGLYLLQRRVDAKYLALDRSKDILFKGIKSWSPSNVQEAYELVYSPLAEDEAYAHLSDALVHGRIHIGNYLDILLYLQFYNAVDNNGYYNMFYVLKAEESGDSMYLLPWDTDMSMGLYWNGETGFAYDDERMIEHISMRKEYENIKEFYPQLDEWLAQRWKELRATMYSAASIEQCIRENIDLIERSGAFQRDNERWGFCYGGEDTWDGLIRWCTARIDVMDRRYAAAEDR